MTKNDIASELRKRIPELPNSTSVKVVECVIDIIVDAFCNDDSIFLRGFGTLEVKHVKARKARNMNTGEAIDMPAYRTVKFKISKNLKNRMNNGSVD